MSKSTKTVIPAKAGIQKTNGLVPRLRFPEFSDAGEWTTKPLGKILSIGNGKDHKHLPDGDVPVYGSGGYMRSVNDYLYDGESVCIGRKGTIDKPVYLKGKFWTVDTLFYTHSFNNSVPRFVYALFQNIEWLKHNEAGGVPSLSKTNIAKIEVAIPEVSEQQKIADCLSSIDALIAAQADRIDAVKTHKKGLMQQLFPREGETVPRLRFPEFQGAGEWEEKSLGEVGQIITGKTPSTKNTDLWGKGIPFITPTDISEDRKYQRITAREVLKTKDVKTIPAGSIVYTCIASIGKIALTTCESTTNQQINSIVVNRALNNEFVFYALVNLTPWIKSIPASSTLAIINKTEFSNILVNFPTNGAEQKRIADCLASLDGVITAHTEKLDALKTHKRGLMQQLFPSPEAVGV